MTPTAAPDSNQAGAIGPGERRERVPSWVMPVATAVVGGIFLLANGWLTHSANSAQELMESRHKNLEDRLSEMKERHDRMDERIKYLERNSTTTGAITSTEAVVVHNREESELPTN